MKKGVKIGGLILLLLFVAAAAFCFWRGWVQFVVGTDECGVMISKTGGVYPEPIEKGHFIWRWEPLLPSNAKILTFSARSEEYRKSVQGSLPSADIYSLQIQQGPDFSYHFDFDIALQAEPPELVSLVASGRIQAQDDLGGYLEQAADRIAALSARFLMAEAEREPGAVLAAYSTEQILAGIGREGDLAGIAVRSITVRQARVPDVALYLKAKESFDGFQQQVGTELSSLARKQAESIVSDNRAVNKLTKIGETLKKYPELADVLKNSDTTAVLKALDTLQ